MASRKATTAAAIWLKDPAAWPIIAVIGGACALAAGASARYLTKCPDVHWNKSNRQSPIRDNQVNAQKWRSHKDGVRNFSENRINAHQSNFQ